MSTPPTGPRDPYIAYVVQQKQSVPADPDISFLNQFIVRALDRKYDYNILLFGDPDNMEPEQAQAAMGLETLADWQEVAMDASYAVLAYSDNWPSLASNVYALAQTWYDAKYQPGGVG